MRKLIYNPEPLRKRAVLLAQERRISGICREIPISRTQFYDVVNGLSASHPMLMLVAEHLGVSMDLLLSTDKKTKSARLQ